MIENDENGMVFLWFDKLANEKSCFILLVVELTAVVSRGFRNSRWNKRRPLVSISISCVLGPLLSLQYRRASDELLLNIFQRQAALEPATGYDFPKAWV